IGTTGPSYKLDVSGDLRVTGQTIFGGVAYTWPSSDGSAGYVLQTNGSGTLSWASAGGISGTGSASQVAFWTASDTLSGNNSLFWDNTNKRLGIGTTGPDRKLDILDSSNPQVRLSQTDGSVYGEIKVDSSGDITIIPSGNEVFIPDDNLRICSGGACPSPSYSGTGNLQVEGQIESDVANGIAPLIVNSTTLITHLNADLLDGKHASSFLTTTRVYTNFTIGTAECNDHPCKVDFDTCHKVCRQHNYLGCNKINSTASASGINCGWTMDGWSCSATGSRITSVECYR
ncbi:hypothetical protein J7J74_02820, partial [bacterium]|nr:hypothetical protein [bacterium]